MDTRSKSSDKRATVASGFSQDTAEDAVFRDSDPFFCFGKGCDLIPWLCDSYSIRACLENFPKTKDDTKNLDTRTEIP